MSVQILNMFLRKVPASSDSRSPQQSQHMHAPRWQIGPFGEILFGTYSSSTEASHIDTPCAFKHPIQSDVIVGCLPIPFHRWQVDVSSELSIVSLAQAVALTQVRNYRDTQDEERFEPLLSDFFCFVPACRAEVRFCGFVQAAAVVQDVQVQGPLHYSLPSVG